MPIYRLWREPFTEAMMEVDAKSGIDAVTHFGRELGEPLTLDGRESISPYLMDLVEPSGPPKFTRPDIPIFLKVSS